MPNTTAIRQRISDLEQKTCKAKAQLQTARKEIAALPQGSNERYRKQLVLNDLRGKYLQAMRTHYDALMTLAHEVSNS